MRTMFVICAGILLSACTKFSNGDIDVFHAEEDGHEYIIFENSKSGSIGVVHAESCKCRTNK